MITEDILKDEDIATEIGEAIASELHLMKMSGKYLLAGGSKTAAGVARTVYRIMTDLEGWKDK